MAEPCENCGELPYVDLNGIEHHACPGLLESFRPGGTRYVPNNPKGRPNILRNPVQYSILIERDSLAFIDSYAEAEKVSRAEATRIIINKGLFSMGTPDNDSEEMDE